MIGVDQVKAASRIHAVAQRNGRRAFGHSNFNHMKPPFHVSK
jgi:hypothetical protein